jgi:hypothetical protein
MIPQTEPEPLTVATDVGVMLQAPPVVGSVNVVQLPVHIFGLPPILPGAAVTVINLVTVQPDPSE